MCCLINMGKESRTLSFTVKMFYEGNGLSVIFIIQHLQVLELIEEWRLTQSLSWKL